MRQYNNINNASKNSVGISFEKYITKKAQMSFTQIFLLVLFSVSIAYMIGMESESVSAFGLDGVNGLPWGQIIQSIPSFGNPGSKIGMDAAKTAMKAMSIIKGDPTKLAAVDKITEGDLVVQANKDQVNGAAALEKLDNPTVVKGTQEALDNKFSAETLFGTEEKPTELRKKYEEGIPKTTDLGQDTSFLREVNKEGNEGVRKAFIESEFKDLKVDENLKGLKINAFDKEKGILQVEDKNGFKTKLSGKDIKGTFGENGLTLDNGAKISGGNGGSAEILKGKDGTLTANLDGKDGTARADLRKMKDSSMNIDGKNGASFSTNENTVYSGQDFSAKVTDTKGVKTTEFDFKNGGESNAESNVEMQIKKGKNLFKPDGEDSSFKITEDEKGFRTEEFTKGRFEGQDTGNRVLEMNNGKGIVSNGGSMEGIDTKNSLLFNTDQNGQLQTINGNGLYDAQIDGKLPVQGLDASNAAQESVLKVGDGENLLTFKGSSIEGFKTSGMSDLMDGDKFSYAYKTEDGLYTNTYEKNFLNGIFKGVSTSTTKGGLSEITGASFGDKTKSFFSNYWSNLKNGDMKTWGITLGVLAAVAGGAAALFAAMGKKKKDDKKILLLRHRQNHL